MAPDLMLDTWSAGYRVAPGRGDTDEVVAPPSSLAGVDEAWSSDHRPLGIFAAAGPRIAGGSTSELALYDVCPTSLALLEQIVPGGLDGTVAEAALNGDFLRRAPVRIGDAAAARASGDDAFSEDEAEAVAAHLKDLGYIE
jgi:hypothetical protein